MVFLYKQVVRLINITQDKLLRGKNFHNGDTNIAIASILHNCRMIADAFVKLENC